MTAGWIWLPVLNLDILLNLLHNDPKFGHFLNLLYKDFKFGHFLNLLTKDAKFGHFLKIVNIICTVCTAVGCSYMYLAICLWTGYTWCNSALTKYSINNRQLYLGSWPCMGGLLYIYNCMTLRITPYQLPFYLVFVIK